MDRLGGMQEDGGGPGAAQSRDDFARDVAGFADARHHHLAGMGEDQFDGADQLAVEPAGGAPRARGLDFHGGPRVGEPLLRSAERSSSEAPFSHAARNPRVLSVSHDDLAALLRQNRNYRYIWMGQVVSEIGDYFNNIAVFALVMEKSGSGLVVSLALCCRARFPPCWPGRSRACCSTGWTAAHHDRERPDPRRDRAGFLLTIHEPRPWLLYLLSALLDVRVAVFHQRARRDPARRSRRPTNCTPPTR